MFVNENSMFSGVGGSLIPSSSSTIGNVVGNTLRVVFCFESYDHYDPSTGRGVTGCKRVTEMVGVGSLVT